MPKSIKDMQSPSPYDPVNTNLAGEVLLPILNGCTSTDGLFAASEGSTYNMWDANIMPPFFCNLMYSLQ